MIIRSSLRPLRTSYSSSKSRTVLRPYLSRLSTSRPLSRHCLKLLPKSLPPIRQSLRYPFHTSTARRYAQPQSADAIMENLNDLYATAKDEFEIAAEETEKKTVYAADDREAAQEAFKELRAAYEQSMKESDPETSKEVQGRVGPRIRELGNAITAMEEKALED